MSSLKLEAGKYYRQRNGIVVGPLRYDAETDTCFKFDIGLPAPCWTVDGHFWESTQIDCEDLVEEVPTPCPLKAAVDAMEAAAQAEQQADAVTHPAHYTAGSIECIDAIKASMSADEFSGYCKGNSMKYLWRYRMKGGVEDLRKSRWYLDRLVEHAA